MLFQVSHGGTGKSCILKNEARGEGGNQTENERLVTDLLATCLVTVRFSGMWIEKTLMKNH